MPKRARLLSQLGQTCPEPLRLWNPLRPRLCLRRPIAKMSFTTNEPAFERRRLGTNPTQDQMYRTRRTIPAIHQSTHTFVSRAFFWCFSSSKQGRSHNTTAAPHDYKTHALTSKRLASSRNFSCHSAGRTVNVNGEDVSAYEPAVAECACTHQSGSTRWCCGSACRCRCSPSLLTWRPRCPAITWDQDIVASEMVGLQCQSEAAHACLFAHA